MRIEWRGDVAVWTLDRPQARNALDAATFAALAAALADAATRPRLRAVVLTGAGGTFASGGDLRELRAATTQQDGQALCRAGRSVCDGIAELPVPVIAALPGAAIGGGAELALACDLRVADEGASLCFKHARMGVTTAWGIVPKLLSLVGHGTASRLLLAAPAVGAREALHLGLVDAVVDLGTCVAQALAWADEISQGAPLAVTGLKALLRGALRAPGEVRAQEEARFVASWASDDHREAIEAFFAARPVTWTGTSSSR
jgi:enoyl-CoA hydratase/carnithine racemase